MVASEVIHDWSRIRTGHGPENTTLLRRFAIGLIKGRGLAVAETMRRLGRDVRRVLDFLKMTGNARPRPSAVGAKPGQARLPETAKTRSPGAAAAVDRRTGSGRDRQSDGPSQVSSVGDPSSGQMKPEARASRPGGLQRQQVREPISLGVASLSARHTHSIVTSVGLPDSVSNANLARVPP